MNTIRPYAIASMLAVSVVMLIPPAFAQTSELTAVIPFEFYASGRLLPAGTYTIAPTNSEVIRIFDPKGNSAYVMTSGRKANSLLNQSRLIFRRYGTTSFLANVYWAGYNTGKTTAVSPRERELAKSFTAPEESVVVAGVAGK